jgi:hypothetical protein
MTTLTEYASTHFPNHVTDPVTDPSAGDLTLTDHTVVAHVVGSANGMELARRVQRALPQADIAAVMVRPTEPSVVSEGDEDPEGVVDLPYRRIAASGVVGAIVAGVAIGTVVGVTASSAIAGLIVGVFAAIVGAVVAAVVGGGGRFGGGRAWEQPHVPDRTVALVAAFAASEREAIAAARVMDELDPYEVRIVASDGAWHSPNT